MLQRGISGTVWCKDTSLLLKEWWMTLSKASVDVSSTSTPASHKHAYLYCFYISLSDYLRFSKTSRKCLDFFPGTPVMKSMRLLTYIISTALMIAHLIMSWNQMGLALIWTTFRMIVRHSARSVRTSSTGRNSLSPIPTAMVHWHVPSLRPILGLSHGLQHWPERFSRVLILSLNSPLLSIKPDTPSTN